MFLKRLYDKDLKVTGVKVLRAGERQNFSPELVQKAAAEGWLTMGGGKITVHGQAGDVVYRIEAMPGYYCSHCDAEIVDANSMVNATLSVGRKHVLDAHKGAESPDDENPAGYCKINHFECVKE